MTKSNVYDMTEGRVLPLLVKFSLPMLFGNIFQQLYNLVDSVIVGQFIGADSLGAVGATSSVTWLLFALCMGLSVGIGILISQYFGANEEEQVKKTIANVVYIVAVSGILMSLIGVAASRPIMQLIKTPPEIIEESITYMKIVSAGTIAVSSYNAIASIMRALGDSKTPLFFLIIASIINVILDLTFILLFGMGVGGAALATIISQAVSAAGCILFARRRNPYFLLEKHHRRLDAVIIKKCCKIGIPVAFQNAMISLSTVILQGIINQFGKTIVTVFTTTSRIEMLLHQPYSTLSAALSTFTGQNVGAGKIERVEKGFRISTLMVAVLSGVMLIIMYVFGGGILHIFTQEQQIIDLGAKAVRITSCFYFPLGMIYVTRSLLNGAGDAFASMLNGVMEVSCRVILPVLVIQLASAGYWGIWYTTGLTWAATGIVGVIRYYQGKWKGKTLVSS